jgi:hypothetical protein
MPGVYHRPVQTCTSFPSRGGGAEFCVLTRLVLATLFSRLPPRLIQKWSFSLPVQAPSPTSDAFSAGWAISHAIPAKMASVSAPRGLQHSKQPPRAGNC